MSEAASVLAGGDEGGAPPAGGAPPVVAPEWAQGWEPDLREWVGKKGVKDPAALAKSYRQLEQTFGAERAGRAVVLPGENAGPEEWDAVWEKLGRPKDPAGYGFQAPEGADPKFAETLTGAFHRAGLRPDQAGIVYDALKELADDGPDVEAQAAKNRSEHEELRREWGPSYEQKVALGRRAFRTMGLDGDAINAIENALGTRKVFEMAARMGEALREDAGIVDTAGKPVSFASPAAAKSRMAEMMADHAFMDRVNNGDRAANAEFDAVIKAAAND